MSIVPGSGSQLPSISGGTTLGTLTGTMTVVIGTNGTTGLALSFDAASMHIDGKVVGTAIVFTASDGSVATLNLKR
jgi:hypothetical protein